MKNSLLTFLLFIFVPSLYGAISDFRLCSDPECRVPISTGVASVRYQSIEPLVLSFNLGEEITIFSKEAGSNKELWGAEVRGKRGYIPKRLVKEMRVFRKPSIQVATEVNPLSQGNKDGHIITSQQPLGSQPKQAFQNGNVATNVPVVEFPKPAELVPSPKTESSSPAARTESNSSGMEDIEDLNDDEEDLPDDSDDSIDDDEGIPYDGDVNVDESTPSTISSELDSSISIDFNNSSETESAPSNSDNKILLNGSPLVESIDSGGVAHSPDNSRHARSLHDDKPQPILPLNPVPTHPPTASDSEHQLSEMSSVIENSEQLPGNSSEPLAEEMGSDNFSIENVIESDINVPSKDDSFAAVPSLLNLDDSSEHSLDASPVEALDTENKLPNDEVKSLLDDDVVIATHLSETNKDLDSKSINEDGDIDVEPEVSLGTIDHNEDAVSPDPINKLAEDLSEAVVDPSAGEEKQFDILPTEEAPPLEITDTLNPDLILAPSESVEPTLSSETFETVEGIAHEATDIPPTTIDHSMENDLSELNEVTDQPETSTPEAITEQGDTNKGFLKSALNWLGLSDTEEPLTSEEAIDSPTEATEAESLSKQIASMNPATPKTIDDLVNEEIEIPLDLTRESSPVAEAIPPLSSVDDKKFCHTESCDELPAKSESMPILLEQQDVPKKVQDDHRHNLNDHHHHHHHDHDHDHHFGHGHSHTPGYIPGFRHHYKPPAPEVPAKEPSAIIAEASGQAPHPPSTPVSVEPIDVAHPSALPPVESMDQSIKPPVDGVPAASIEAFTESSFNPVTDYVSAEEIFRAAEAQNGKLLEEQESATGSFDWLTSFSALAPETTPSAFIVVVVVASITAFFTAYFLIDKFSRDSFYLAKISQLETQNYETSVAKEECGSVQDQLTEHETAAAELRSQNEKLVADNELLAAEKSRLSLKISDMAREKEELEKELESVTESGLEATKMLADLMASQSESDEFKNSVEALKQQLNSQQLATEDVVSILRIKTSENETLKVDVEELRVEVDKYKVRLKTLQGDLETQRASIRNYKQQIANENGELLKLKQEREAWVIERRSLTGQVKDANREVTDLNGKIDHLKSALKTKELDLANTLELMKESGTDSQSILQLSSLVQLESDLAQSSATIEKLSEELKTLTEQKRIDDEEKAALQTQLDAALAASQEAAKEKIEAETQLKVLSTYFKEKENELQKELGTHEAKRVVTEENFTETVQKIMETEAALTLYKSQVETLTKEIEEQEKSYKSRLSTLEQRTHESWVNARQLDRRLEESKLEAATLRQRLTVVEKEKEALLVAKENGTNTNGGPEIEIHQTLGKRHIGTVGNNMEDLAMMEPPLLSPPLPQSGLDLTLGGIPPPLPLPGMPGMAPFDSMFPPHFMPPAPFMPAESGIPLNMLPAIPPPLPGMVSDHRPPPLGMISSASFDVDFRREMSDPPRRYPSPPRRYPSPLGSDRSARSDRSDRMDRYDEPYRPLSPYGRHSGRPRSVGRSRDVSPERPRSYSPLPSPLYPNNGVHSPDDWEDSRNFRPQMMRTGSLRHPPGPKTSSPLIHPFDSSERRAPPPPL